MNLILNSDHPQEDIDDLIFADEEPYVSTR